MADLHVAYWNVRTLQDVGGEALTIRELRQCNGDVACLSEVRIPNSGQSVIKVPGEDACYHLYHSGVVDNSGRHGVAIALCEATQAAFWESISFCLVSAPMNLNVTTVYAPTLDAEEEAKASSYDDL